MTENKQVYQSYDYWCTIYFCLFWQYGVKNQLFGTDPSYLFWSRSGKYTVIRIQTDLFSHNEFTVDFINYTKEAKLNFSHERLRSQHVKPCTTLRGWEKNHAVLKEAVSRDFLPPFFAWIKPIWAPDKQDKMVLLKNSFSRSRTPSRLTLCWVDNWNVCKSKIG